MAQYHTRKAEISDCDGIFKQIQELADYFESDSLRLSVENLRNDGFGDHPHFYCFVAESDTLGQNKNELMGFAMCHFRYSINTGTYLYMNGLHVKGTYRGMGIGTKLFKDVEKFALENKCKSLQWKLTKPFPKTIDFYRKMGVDDTKNVKKFKKTMY